jgi:hypothetical protein
MYAEITCIYVNMDGNDTEKLKVREVPQRIS